LSIVVPLKSKKPDTVKEHEVTGASEIMAEMDCSEFEDLLGDYIGRELDTKTRKRVAEHSLQCLGCRKLLDDVKARLHEVEDHGGSGTLPELDAGLETIPKRHGVLSCGDFEELVTEFLDGFVPAPVYHKFVAHSDQCDECSTVLTGVVYAVAACHSVHMNEELEVPSNLSRSLAELPCRESRPSLSPCDKASLPAPARAASRPRFRKLGRLAKSLAAKMPTSLPGYATASGLIAASLAMLFFGSPQDLGWFGIYRRAQSRPAAAERTASVDELERADSQMDEPPSRLNQVESDFGKAWKSMDRRRVGGLTGGASEEMKRAIVGGLTTSLVAR
jgi:hypothetical protein